MIKVVAATLLAAVISGCVVAPGPYPVYGYPVGYYDPALGYWTGAEWDFHFYEYGHRGYGHRYYHHH
jgi:hypothetical protein